MIYRESFRHDFRIPGYFLRHGCALLPVRMGSGNFLAWQKLPHQNVRELLQPVRPQFQQSDQRGMDERAQFQRNRRAAAEEDLLQLVELGFRDGTEQSYAKSLSNRRVDSREG